MDDPIVAPELATQTEDVALAKKPYVTPRLELLDVEATQNGPGIPPDSGGIDFS